MKPEDRKHTQRRRSTAGDRADFLTPNRSSAPQPVEAQASDLYAPSNPNAMNDFQTGR